MEKKNTLTQAFFWLFIGLLVCFGTSYLTTLSQGIFMSVYGAFGGYGYIVYFIAEIVIALCLSLFIKKINPLLAKILYIAYTFLTGLGLTGIFVIYTSSSIAFVFLATALIFGIFAFIGKTTKIDLSKWSVYLFIALLAIIILEIINIFLANNSLDMVLCIVTIIIFSGYIAYDVQFALEASYLAETENKGIFCAFQLFLDFINIFLKLLRLFAKNND